jgi:hypothetical protein
MNIFILDYDLDKCAAYHIDKHIIKMPLEAAQMLCTTIFVDKYLGYVPRNLNKEEREVLKCEADKVRDLVPEDRPIAYLPTHVNHPCTVWARVSMENFYWLYCYAHALNSEYHYRYGGKSHKAVEAVCKVAHWPTRLENLGLTPFAQAMPDNYKHEDAVTAYRRFYIGDKDAFATWKHRPQPDWYIREH